MPINNFQDTFTSAPAWLVLSVIGSLGIGGLVWAIRAMRSDGSFGAVAGRPWKEGAD